MCAPRVNRTIYDTRGVQSRQIARREEPVRFVELGPYSDVSEAVVFPATLNASADLFNPANVRYISPGCPAAIPAEWNDYALLVAARGSGGYETLPVLCEVLTYSDIPPSFSKQRMPAYYGIAGTDTASDFDANLNKKWPGSAGALVDATARSIGVIHTLARASAVLHVANRDAAQALTVTVYGVSQFLGTAADSRVEIVPATAVAADSNASFNWASRHYSVEIVAQFALAPTTGTNSSFRLELHDTPL